MRNPSTTSPNKHLTRIPSKGFIVLCLLIVLVPTVVKAAGSFFLSSKYKDRIIILEGENPIDSNLPDAGNKVVKNRGFFGGRSLQLDSPTAPQSGYSVRYEVNILKENTYALLIAGTPPGPLYEGSQWHSPYSISIDDGEPLLLTEENLKAEWPLFFKYQYSRGGYFFTKVLTQSLSQGRHVVKVHVNHRRQFDGHFTIYLDALIFIPTDLNPKSHVGKLPKEIFEE